MKYWQTQKEALKHTKNILTPRALVVYLVDLLFYVILYYSLVFFGTALTKQMDLFQYGFSNMGDLGVFVKNVIYVAIIALITIIILTIAFKGFLYNYLKKGKHTIRYYLTFLLLGVITWAIFMLLTFGLKYILLPEIFMPFLTIVLVPIYSYFATQSFYLNDTKIRNTYKNIWTMVKHFYYFVIPFIVSSIIIFIASIIYVLTGSFDTFAKPTIILFCLIILIFLTWQRYYIIGMCNQIIKKDKLKLYKY
jgi:hypothetical protein